MSDDKDKRTYKDILSSFIQELNEKDPDLNLKYEDLGEQEQLELLDVLLEQCNHSIKPFITHVLGYEWRWYYKYWFDTFLKYDIITIIMSRGGGKSFYWTQLLPQYLSFIQKGYETIISSFNEKATFDFLKAIRTDIEDNELLSSKIPEAKSSDWNKGNLDFKNKSNIRGISITSQIRRVHPNYFICDDILNDDVELSPEEIKKKIYATVIPTLETKKGKFVLIGTKFAEDDIFSFMKEKALEEDSYHYVEIRVNLDEKNEEVYFIMETENGAMRKVKDDGIYSYQRLLSLKNVEPIYFSREFECNIVSDEEAPFPINKLLELRDKKLSYEMERDPKRIYKGGLDFSVSTAKDADDTVLMLGYTDEDNIIIPAHIVNDNKYETPERVALLKRAMIKFGKPEVLAEKNSMGQTNIDNINRENFRLIPFHTSRLSKIDLTEYASRMVKQGKVKFPYKTPRDQIITDKLIQQLSGVKEKKTRLGKRSYEGTTKHDDYYMAFILMVKQLSTLGGPVKIHSFKRSDLI